MELLREVYEKKAPYEYVPDSICNRARAAFNKGVECILKNASCPKWQTNRLVCTT